MPADRIYFLDAEAHISRPPEVIEAANDEEAAQKARQFIDGKDIEVWREEYLVANLPRAKLHQIDRPARPSKAEKKS